MIWPRRFGMRFFQSANLPGVILTLYYRAHGLNYVQILSFEIVLSLTRSSAHRMWKRGEFRRRGSQNTFAKESRARWRSPPP